MIVDEMLTVQTGEVWSDAYAFTAYSEDAQGRLSQPLIGLVFATLYCMDQRSNKKKKRKKRKKRRQSRSLQNTSHIGARDTHLLLCVLDFIVLSYVLMD
jgi:hypothetical protein